MVPFNLYSGWDAPKIFPYSKILYNYLGVQRMQTKLVEKFGMPQGIPNQNRG